MLQQQGKDAEHGTGHACMHTCRSHSMSMCRVCLWAALMAVTMQQ